MTPDSDKFFTTRWTCVARSKGDSDEARAALSELCDFYYQPVQAFVRASVRDQESAKDLTQAFFARVLGRTAFDGAAPEKGRFRSYLLGAVKHFLYETRRNARAEKRGNNHVHVVIEPGTDTTPGFEPIDDKHFPPDTDFDRRWAMTLLVRALEKLGDEMKAEEKSKHFRTLKPWLTGDHSGLRQGHAAVSLGMNENAVKVAIHRLRRRFRDTVKDEVAQTLSKPEQVSEELKHLEAVLRGK